MKQTGRVLNQGFTLIELMIVVAIVAILASLAIPQYSAYTTRARMTEGLVLASTAQDVVADFLNSGNGGGAATGYSTGFTWSGTTANVQQIAVDAATGNIKIVYTAAAGGGTLYLNPYTSSSGVISPLPTGTSSFMPPSAALQWQCASQDTVLVVSSGQQGTVPAALAPSICR